MTNRSNKPSSKGKAADLERVRNNQRRCRARQKEYIASLENRIHQYESAGAESETNKKLEQLAAENKSLKKLLHSLGLRDDFLQAYRNAMQIAPNLSLTSLLDNQSYSQAKNCRSPSLFLDVEQPHTTQATNHDNQAQNMSDDSNSKVRAPESGCQDSIQEDVLSPLNFFDLPTTSISVPELVPLDFPSESLEQLDLDSLMITGFSNTVTSDNVSETTSLCSWAFSLVMKNNAKGYSVADLDLKLRAGYRFGATCTQGCRVDNKILLSVLAEVS
ncbi:hypothetical protein DM02DRAFT_298805 [Periconia macrospinosa]|uniref:BZIP domain-containing protein n=1 Tax=Periconia macrospinosa TaxID=97972 RepID=A0A2V1DW48_9PLEO|nr:hypothetical protein DM02DRAFT_298805 [Periconia macrospinosa]